MLPGYVYAVLVQSFSFLIYRYYQLRKERPVGYMATVLPVSALLTVVNIVAAGYYWGIWWLLGAIAISSQSTLWYIRWFGFNRMSMVVVSAPLFAVFSLLFAMEAFGSPTLPESWLHFSASGGASTEPASRQAGLAVPGTPYEQCVAQTSSPGHSGYIPGYVSGIRLVAAQYTCRSYIDAANNEARASGACLIEKIKSISDGTKYWGMVRMCFGDRNITQDHIFAACMLNDYATVYTDAEMTALMNKCSALVRDLQAKNRKG